MAEALNGAGVESAERKREGMFVVKEEIEEVKKKETSKKGETKATGRRNGGEENTANKMVSEKENFKFI